MNPSNFVRGLLACAILLLPPAHAQAPGAADPSADAGRALAPYFAVKDAPPGVDPLPLKATRVDVTVAGVIAEARVTQIYRNEGTVPIEARYVFPASTRAAVHALRLRVGNRVVDAEIREKQQARAEYQQAKRAGQSAALLEQQRPNVFSMAIANVMPGDEIAVDLRYTETIVSTDGVYRFVFPTVVGPRYNGAAAVAGSATESHRPEGWIAQPFLRAGQTAAPTFEFHAAVLAPMPVQALRSPTHPIAIHGVGERKVLVHLAADRAHTNRDLVLEYQLAGSRTAAGVLVYQDPRPDGENHFLAMVEPPARVTATEVVPREYVFIVDVSGSMHGFPLDTTKELLKDLIGRLRPTDTFNVIPFAGGHSLLHPASVPASAENIGQALRFLAAQNGGGGTELLPALRTALAMPAGSGRARTFLIVTDGFVTIEKEAFDLVRDKLGQANVFAFGIGSSVNRHLIEGLARAGRGEPFFVLNPGEASREAGRLR